MCFTTISIQSSEKCNPIDTIYSNAGGKLDSLLYISFNYKIEMMRSAFVTAKGTVIGIPKLLTEIKVSYGLEQKSRKEI